MSESNGKRRVVITGLGVVAPGAIGKNEFFRMLQSGESQVKPVTSFDASCFPTKIAAEIEKLPLEDYLTHDQIKRMDRYAHFATIASKMSIQDAELKFHTTEDQERTGVFEGSSLGPHHWVYQQHGNLIKKGYARFHPTTAVGGFFGAPGSFTAIEYKLKGPNVTVSTGSVSASNAIGYAFRAIKSGEIDVAIAGGAEAPILAPIFAAFCKVKAMSTRNDEPKKACRPFDRDRDGLVLGEGSGMMVLEDLGHAIKRDARIYAEIAGFSMTNDGYNIVRADADCMQIARATKMALEEARLAPEEIEYINAHGTSTPINDRIETCAIKKSFGDCAYRIPVSSTKSAIGHLLGAAGGVEAVACIQSIEKSYIPPTLNYEQKDSDCDLDYVPMQGRHKTVNTVLSYSFSFGGKNCVLIFKKYVDQ